MSPEQEILATRLSEMAGKAGARAVFEGRDSPFDTQVHLTETELAEMLTAACFATWGAAHDAFEKALRRRIDIGQLKQMF